MTDRCHHSGDMDTTRKQARTYEGKYFDRTVNKWLCFACGTAQDRPPVKVRQLKHVIRAKQRKKEQAKERIMYTYKELIDNQEAYDAFAHAQETLTRKHVVRGTRVYFDDPTGELKVGIYNGLTSITALDTRPADSIRAVLRVFQDYMIIIPWTRVKYPV